MSDRQNYSEETKAAVMAALLTGQSVSEVAKAYRIPLGTVKRWSAAAKESLEPVRSAKRERIGDLIVEYLEEGLVTLREQVKVFRGKEWLEKQSASEVAVLHGVIADKQIRLLEALANAEQPEEDEADAD